MNLGFNQLIAAGTKNSAPNISKNIRNAMRRPISALNRRSDIAGHRRSGIIIVIAVIITPFPAEFKEV
jgi:hypothetical protein